MSDLLVPLLSVPAAMSNWKHRQSQSGPFSHSLSSHPRRLATKGTIENPSMEFLAKFRALEIKFETVERLEAHTNNISDNQIHQQRPISQSSGRTIEIRRQLVRVVHQESLRPISLEEVSAHDHSEDCWLVIRDFVYDCTEFLRLHPGGQEVLLEYAGRDASFAFLSAGHSKAAQRILDKFLIGELPMHERLFRKPGGFKIDF